MSRPLMGVLLLALALRIGTAIAFDGRTFSADEAHWQRMADLYGKADCKARKPVFPTSTIPALHRLHLWHVGL